MSPTTDPREAARLGALAGYDILDTPREKDFDDVAALASRICGTPIAVVNLIGEGRQFFKAEVGLGVRETPLESSFCARAILEEEFLLVPDATKDPRFSGNPLVTGEPGLRFYAGALLRTEEGHALGTVCVLDMEPRDLDALQIDTLRLLARQVMKQLELRRALRRQRGSEARIGLIARASAALLSTRDPAASLRPILAQAREILGFEQSYAYDVTPDHRHLRLTHAIGADVETCELLRFVSCDVPLCGLVAESGEAVVLEHLQADIEPRHAFARDAGLDAFAGFPIMSQGRIVGVISFASRVVPAFEEDALSFFATMARFLSVARERLDTETALRASEERSRTAEEAGSIGTFELDVATGTLGVSAEFCRVFGLPVAPTYPASVLEGLIVPEDADLRSRDTTRRDGTAARDVEYRIRRADDGRIRWIARHARFSSEQEGGPQRMVGMVRDVTDRRRLQDFQGALLSLGDRLRAATSSAEVVGAASEILGRTLAASRTGYSRIDLRGDLFEVERDWTAPGTVSLTGRHGLSKFRTTIEQLRRGESIVVANVAEAPSLADDASGYAAIGTRAQIKVPLVERGELVGLLYAHQAEARAWSKDEVDFVHGVADRTHAALAKVQAETDQRVLNQELSHRMKNTLAMVQAIAVQTLKGVSEREPVEAFTRRVHALAGANDVLLQQSWAAARIKAVVKAVLGTFGQADRFEVSGPDINLGPRATLSLSLLLHELATNAVKYGALAGDAGRVVISWRLAGGDGDRTVVLDWVEAGGPSVREPSRKGFGSRLIGMGLIGTGGVDLRFPPTGFEAEFRAPLAQMQAS